MANLYLSDTLEDLDGYMFGTPIEAANNLTGNNNVQVEMALRYAVGDIDGSSGYTIQAGSFSSTASQISFVVLGPAGVDPVKVVLSGSGFTPNASGLSGIYGQSAFSITQVQVLSSKTGNIDWSVPVTTLTVDTSINVTSQGRLDSFSLSGITMQEGSLKVALTGALSLGDLIDSSGSVSFNGGTFTNGKLEVTYDTEADPSKTELAQITLNGSFTYDAGKSSALAVDGVVSGFGLKVFGGSDLTADPVHYLYGTDLGITLTEIRDLEGNNWSLATALQHVFNGASDTVHTYVDTMIPEGFEKVIIEGTGAVDVQVNGLNNVITGNSGDNVVDGAGGTDTFVTSGTLSSALLNADGSIEIETSTGGTDTLYHVEKVQVGNASAVDAVSLVTGMSSADNTYVVRPGTANSISLGSGGVTPVTSSGVLTFSAVKDLYYGDYDVLEISGGGFLVARNIKETYVPNASNTQAIELLKVKFDGTLDTTFGSGGSVVIERPVGKGFADTLALAQTSDGEFILAKTNLGTDPQFVKISATGSLISTYTPALPSEITPGSFRISDVKTYSDGSFVVVGNSYVGPAASDALVVLKFTSSGVLDQSFSGNYSHSWITAEYPGVFWSEPGAVIDVSNVPENLIGSVFHEYTDTGGLHRYVTLLSQSNSSEGMHSILTTIDLVTGNNVGEYHTNLEGTQGLAISGTGGDGFYLLSREMSSGILKLFKFSDGSIQSSVVVPSGSNSYLAEDARPLTVDSDGCAIFALRDSAGGVNLLRFDPVKNKFSSINFDPFDSSVEQPMWVVEQNRDIFVGSFSEIYTSDPTSTRYDTVSAFSIAPDGSLVRDSEFNYKLLTPVEYTLTSFDGSQIPSWVTLDTSGADPKIKVSAATTAADAGHHYLVLTATGSTTVSKVFDVYIKPLDAGTNDTYVLDTTRVSAGSSIVPLDKDGNASPLGLDTLDLSGANGLVGANSEIIVDAKGGLSGTPEITYWKDGTAAGGQVSYAIDGFERYVLGASTGYFIGRDDLSEYVVIKGGKNYDIVLGSSLTGQVETDIISFEGGQASVEIALSNADDPNTPVVAKVGTGVGAVTHNISGAESVIGSEVADKITGNYADNFLIGNGGDDEIAGGAGDDVLVGGVGAGDKLFGGTGSDQLVDLDGGTLRGNEVQLAANDKANAQKDLFVVNKGATIENFQLSESGTGLAGRSGNANDAIVFNLNLGVIAGLTDVTGWSWVNYNATMTDTQKKAFSAAVRDHVKFDTPVETPVGDVTNVKLELFMYETLNSDGTLSGSKVKVGEVTIADVEKASGDQLVIVGLNKATYPGPQPDVDLNSFPSLFMQTISSETENANIAIALESVKAGTIRQLPGQVVMSAKWDGAAHFYNPAEGNQKIIATNAKDTVELLVQTLADTNGDGKGDAGSDKVYDIGGDDTLSFSNANIDDLHFEAVTVGREVGHQSLKVSYEQTNGTDTNVGDLTWTGHFRSGVDMSLDQVTVADVGGINGQVTYQMADTVYNWDKGVFKGVDLVAQAGEDTIMVGQDNAGKSDHFVIKDGFTVNSTVETTDIYIWGLDSNATTANKTNTLDKIDLSDFGVLDSGDIDLNTANQTMTVSIANSAGTADDRLVIHLMDTNLTTLDDILVYQKATI